MPWSDDGSIHEQDNQYTWSATDSPQLGYWDGTVFTVSTRLFRFRARGFVPKRESGPARPHDDRAVREATVW